MSATTSDLRTRHCRPYDKGESPLSSNEIGEFAALVSDWTIREEDPALVRQFGFKNYYETLSFINAVAWVAHREDHHPDISFGYKSCSIEFTTHSVGGLTENDFICASRIDALLE